MSIKPLSKTELGTAEMIAETGLHRNQAKALILLNRCEEVRSVEIERLCKMRQPEVSIAMSALRDRGWCAVRYERKPGKGRPVHIYSLSISLDQILTELAEAEREKLAAFQDRIVSLEALRSE